MSDGEPQHLLPPLLYDTTISPTATSSPTAPHFTTKVDSDRLKNGTVHGNANKTPSHVGGRHLSLPLTPHPDTENDVIYTDGVNQNVGDHVRPVAAGIETEIVPSTVSAGGGMAVSKDWRLPAAADIHPQDEQERYERGVSDKNRDTLQKKPTKDLTGVKGMLSRVDN